MAIYDFRCRNCKSEFTIPVNSDEEITDLICVECKSERLEITGYNRDDADIINVIFEKLAELKAELRHLRKRFRRLQETQAVDEYGH